MLEKVLSGLMNSLLDDRVAVMQSYDLRLREFGTCLGLNSYEDLTSLLGELI